jgi:hypothetical protein
MREWWRRALAASFLPLSPPPSSAEQQEREQKALEDGRYWDYVPAQDDEADKGAGARRRKPAAARRPLTEQEARERAAQQAKRLANQPKRKLYYDPERLRTVFAKETKQEIEERKTKSRVRGGLGWGVGRLLLSHRAARRSRSCSRLRAETKALRRTRAFITAKWCRCRCDPRGNPE